LPAETGLDLFCRFLLSSRPLELRFLQFKTPLVLSPLEFVDFSSDCFETVPVPPVPIAQTEFSEITHSSSRPVAEFSVTPRRISDVSICKHVCWPADGQFVEWLLPAGSWRRLRSLWRWRIWRWRMLTVPDGNCSRLSFRRTLQPRDSSGRCPSGADLGLLTTAGISAADGHDRHSANLLIHSR